MKGKILNYIKQKKIISGRELRNHFNISRQAINKHLQVLIKNNKIYKSGNTRAALYHIYQNEKLTLKIKKKYILSEIQEDAVFNQISHSLNLKNNLNQNSLDNFNYIFTEILNNAIEHSNSKSALIEVSINAYDIETKISDYGIGVFYSIYDKFNLKDEYEAMGELIKGKTTTMKKRHTGEGLFFSSKLADFFHLKSHKLKLIFDNSKQDVFIQKTRMYRGSELFFRLKKKSKKNIQKIFSKYAPKNYDYKFERTKVYVSLFQSKYISRSEAKRLLAGLNHKFKEIILDFKNVKSIGQGFCDEIFRVFKNTYPEIIINAINISPEINIMIKHVVDNKL